MEIHIPPIVIPPIVLPTVPTYSNGTIDISNSTQRKVDASRYMNVEIIGNDYGNSIKGSRGADTVITGEGDDTVSLGAGADVFMYTGGDDILLDYSSIDTILVDGDDIEVESAETVGADVVLTTNVGTLTLKRAKNQEISIYDEDGESVYPSIGGGLPEGWSLNAMHTYLKATVASPLDSLDLNEYDALSGVRVVDASRTKSGVEIIAHDDDVSIKGGKGDDTIYSGLGDDTVSLGTGADIFIYNGGDDIIHDYGFGDDSIQFAENVVLEFVETIGNNVVFTTSEGELTVKHGRNRDITIYDADGSVIYPMGGCIPPWYDVYGWKYDPRGARMTATVTAPDDLDLTDYDAENIRVVDASKSKSGVQIIAHDGDMSIKAGRGNDTIYSGLGNDIVSLGAGADVFVYNGGDDVIMDYTAGKDTIQIDTGEISIEAVDTIGNHVIFTTNEGELTVRNGRHKEITILDLDGEQVYPEPPPALPDGWRGSNNGILWAESAVPEALDLNEDYGVEYRFVRADKATVGVEIIANDLGNSIMGGRGADTIVSGAGDDTLYGRQGADVFVYTGGNDVLQDFQAGTDTIVIDSDTITIEGVDTIGTSVIFTTNEGALIVKGGKNKDVTIFDMNGDSVFSAATPALPEGWTYGKSRAEIKAFDFAEDIDLNESYGSGVSIVDASKIQTGVEIVGNDYGNSIKGGRGADTITGGSGDDIINLGAGADIYIYTGGNDIVADYAAEDTIKVDSAEISLTAVETVGNNIVLTFDEGTLTVRGGKGKALNVVDSESLTSILPTVAAATLPAGWKYYNSTKNKLIASIASAESVDLGESYGSTVRIVDASKTTGGIEIVGSNIGNSLKGGRGADTITGGGGNDTLIGGAGADVFVYTGGNDLITDYAATDTIVVDTGAVSVTGVATIGNDVVYSTSEGDLTVRRGKGKAISIFDIDGGEITFTASSADLLEDDNFRGVETDLDAIIAVDFSVTNLQPSSVDPFAQEQPLLTFSKDK